MLGCEVRTQVRRPTSREARAQVAAAAKPLCYACTYLYRIFRCWVLGLMNLALLPFLSLFLILRPGPRAQHCLDVSCCGRLTAHSKQTGAAREQISRCLSLTARLLVALFFYGATVQHWALEPSCRSGETLLYLYPAS